MALQDLFNQYAQQTNDGRYFMPFANTLSGQQFAQRGSGFIGDGGEEQVAGQNDDPSYSRPTGTTYNSLSDYFNALDPSFYVTGQNPDGSPIDPSHAQNALSGTGTRGNYNDQSGYFFDPNSIQGFHPASTSGGKPNDTGLWQAISLLAPAVGGVFMGAGAGGSVGSSAFGDAANVPAAAGSSLGSTAGSVTGDIGENTGQTTMTGNAGGDQVSNFDDLVSNDQYSNYDSSDYNMDNPQTSSTDYSNYDSSDYRADNPGDFPPSENGNPFQNMKLDDVSKLASLYKLLGGGRGGRGGNGNYQFPAGDALGGLLEFLGRNRQTGQLNSAANAAANRADPFGGQRGFYQDELKKSYTDPNYFTNSPVFKGLNDYALNATNAKMAAGGYNMSGNQMDQLTQTAARTGYNYALPEQQQLAGLAGSQFNPALAGQIQLQGQTAGINAGLGAQGALGNLFNTVNEGQQPDIVSRLFGGQSGNKTLAQTIGLS